MHSLSTGTAIPLGAVPYGTPNMHVSIQERLNASALTGCRSSRVATPSWPG
jgi:hypothetical protein